jgi:hypothetical protein
VSPEGSTFKAGKYSFSHASSTAPQNILPTFEYPDNSKWPKKFLDKQLFIMELPEWSCYHGKGGEYNYDMIR